MTEKDLELQRLGQNLSKAKRELREKNELIKILKSDLYKAVIYDCKCSLCMKVDFCENEKITENCFVWKKERI